MAQKNRVDLSAIILANIPNNSTELITPLKHREVEDDLKDSNFNIIDDNASHVKYTPSVSANWNVTIPTEVKGGLDQLADRLKTVETSLINNHSLSVFYVSKQGNDGTAQEGNELRPYLTINGAITAMGANPTNKKLVVLGGGTYPDTGSITITITNATNCVFDFGSANIVGDFTGTTINNSYVNFKGGKLTGNFTTTGTNTLYDFTGGEITGTFTANSVFNSTFLLSKIGSNVAVGNSSYSYFDFNNATINGSFVFYNTYTCVVKNAYVNVVTQCWLETYICDNINILSSTVSINFSVYYSYNCKFISNATNTLQSSGSNFKKLINCIIKNTSNGITIFRLPYSSFINCEIESNTGVTISSEPSALDDIKKTIQLFNCKVKSASNYNFFGENGIANLIAYNSKFTTSNQHNIYISNDVANPSKWLQFKNCEFYTTSTFSNVQLTSALIRPIDVNYQFIGCSFYTETGYAFLEPTYNVSDAGKVIAINCLANKTALANPAPNPAKIVEQNNYFDVNLQNFNNI